ncbi:MAG: outer membrane beta-barrel protein, partial [Acidobacteria bacterium]|nr:outer membrane beta-barrel protein [Acidobacteriota bacterium]
HYDRPQFFVNLVGGQREGTPANGSSFPEYSTFTGSYFMQYRLTAPIDVEVFGGRDVAYAIGANDPYYFETRNGGALRFQLGRTLSTRIFGESGTNDYTELPGNPREDDVTRVGASLSVPVWRTLALTVTAAQDDYESNIPGFDRSVLRWGATVGLRNLIFR